MAADPFSSRQPLPGLLRIRIKDRLRIEPLDANHWHRPGPRLPRHPKPASPPAGGQLPTHVDVLTSLT